MTENLKFILQKWHFFMSSTQNHEARQILFTEIWQRYQQRLLFFIRNMVGAEAEDMLHDIMLKVYQNLEKYNPIYSFNTWIYTIARNHCLNFLQKKKLSITSLEKTNPGAHGLTNHTNPEKEIIDQEKVAKIDAYLQQLEPDYQQMAFLRFYEGLKIKQIAEVLNVPVGTVKSRIHLIKKALKTELEL